MELALASVFIFFIILILWEIKADFVLFIFGFAAYIFLLFMLYCLVIEIQAIGFQCFKPLFGERGKEAYVISYFIIFLQIVTFVIALYIIIPFAPNTWNNSLGLLYVLLINLPLSSGFAIIIFFIGLRKLNKIE
ncbi:hypothetical protein ES703_121401 [subsurface metagenome]